MGAPIESVGGKAVTVGRSGADVHLTWVDPPGGQSGDALFDPADARELGRRLMAAGINAEADAHAGRQSRIILEIAEERAAQDALFGVQDLPDGTGAPNSRALSDTMRAVCDEAFDAGEGTYLHIFMEEVFEAAAESGPAKLRAEMIQAVAVGVKWIEAIDRREGR